MPPSGVWCDQMCKHERVTECNQLLHTTMLYKEGDHSDTTKRVNRRVHVM